MWCRAYESGWLQYGKARGPMAETRSYRAGETLFVVFQHSEPREMTVESVGRKWVTLDDERYRFARGSRQLDGKGYSSPGTVYDSRQQYDAELERRKLWLRLRELTQRSAPDHLDNTQLEQALKLLGGNP